MTRDELATSIVKGELTEIEGAVRVLWFILRFEGRDGVKPDEVVDFFAKQSISAPNRSRLKARLCSDRRVLRDRVTGEIRLRKAAKVELDAAPPPPRPTTTLVTHLEAHAARLADGQTRSFVIETVECTRNGQQRAAIIMGWCGAISVLQAHVYTHYLAEFNADAVKNGVLKSPAKSLADLRNISKESHFLESLARISVIDDATKRALKRCLDRRNDAGHPSEVRFSEAAVADHLEALMLNVFARFGVSGVSEAA